MNPVRLFSRPAAIRSISSNPSLRGITRPASKLTPSKTIPAPPTPLTTLATMDKASAPDAPKAGITAWASKDGSFNRKPSAFRNAISAAPGADFPAEANRYHLYVSYACPWAHRVLIVRQLKGLERIIDFTAVHWHMGEGGWRFVGATDADAPVPGANARPDPVNPGFTHVRDVYHKVQPGYEGRYLVPTLYDVKTERIVSNESSEIIRFLYTEFDALVEERFRAPGVDLLPADLRAGIEETNGWTYEMINNGVYRAGFATSQAAYEEAVTGLFAHLDRAEAHLGSVAGEGPFYYGSRLTEADVRLYTTIVRFDAVYHQHFKCNLAMIRDGYPNLHRWVRHLYWDVPAFHDTTQFEHIKKHYTKSHGQINPHAITPLGPVPDILPKDEEVPAVRAAIDGEANKRKKTQL